MQVRISRLIQSVVGRYRGFAARVASIFREEVQKDAPSEKTKELRTRWSDVFGVTLFVVVVVWFVMGAALPLIALSPICDTAQAGQIGDTFGAVNSLFSGLAFALLLVTMWMQREELELQRSEIRENREEMKKHRAETARQADIQATMNRLEKMSILQKDLQPIINQNLSQSAYQNIRFVLIESWARRGIIDNQKPKDGILFSGEVEVLFRLDNIVSLLRPLMAEVGKIESSDQRLGTFFESPVFVSDLNTILIRLREMKSSWMWRESITPLDELLTSISPVRPVSAADRLVVLRLFSERIELLTQEIRHTERAIDSVHIQNLVE